MIGRVRELERLRSLLDPAPTPRVALVSGEAGVGKTRLVAELLASCSPGTPALVAHAEEGAMGRPYGLLLEAVEPLVAGWAQLPPALAPRAEPLSFLLGQVAPRLAQPTERDFAEEELLRAATDLVRHLGAGGVLVFEDLHWADAESLSLFGRLATTHDLPLVLVGSFRPEDLGRGHLAGLVAIIERHHAVARVAVEKLTEDEVGALLAAVYGRPVPYPVATALHRRTGGNPFFLEELVGAAGDAAPEQLASIPLPVTLTEAVLRHLDGLGPGLRQVADTAAVLGQRIPFDLLAAVTGLPENELVDALRALVHRGLVVETDPDVFSFRHALTREAVASRLLGRERRRLHEKALVALNESGSEDWATLVHHAAGAHRWAELLEAARAGAVRYLQTGSTWQALRMAELGLNEAGDDPLLLETAARAAWALNLHDSAIEWAEKWRALLATTGDDRALVPALRLLARLRWETGDVPGHLAIVDEALALAERLGPGEERAWLYNLVAESRMLTMSQADALAWGKRALAEAEAGGFAAVRAAALVNYASTLTEVPGCFEEGARLLRQAADAAEAVGDVHSALRALHNLKAGFVLWPPEESRSILERLARLAERAGRRDWLPNVCALEASFLAHVEGDLPSARAALAAGRAAGELSWCNEVPWIRTLEAVLALEAGDLDAAAAGVGALPPSWVAASGGAYGSWGAVAEVAAAQGDLPAARAALAAFAAWAAAGPPEWLWACDAWHRALRASLDAGLPPTEILDLCGRVPPPPPVPHDVDCAWVPHLAAAVAEASGDPAGAIGCYRAALAPSGRVRAPSLVADVHAGLARCLLAAGDHAGALDHARVARGLLDRWPGPRRDAVDALLRRLEGASLAAKGPGALTPREREVAALVAEGLTNGEIAKRLYISTKTASVHVSNILTKLGMSSRSEIAAWVARGLMG